MLKSLSSFLIFSASPILASVTPSVVEKLNVKCVFTESCFARSINDENCRVEHLELKIVKKNGEPFVSVTKPNGSVEAGLARSFTKYDGLDYILIVSGDGSGGSYVTLLPDRSAIWTGHFTLQDNVSYSHFGRCEEIT